MLLKVKYRFQKQKKKKNNRKAQQPSLISLLQQAIEKFKKREITLCWV